MQLVLELFKKIFVALQGVYTKAESDAALATEATAREQADAKHDAEIDWLKTAVDGDWKTYMLARAKLTGIQKNIDTVNRAIKEYGEDSTAALPSRMIEDWKNLYVDYEAWLMEIGEPTPLISGFWVAYFNALQRWLENPTEVVNWTKDVHPPSEVASAESPFVVSLKEGNIIGAYMYGSIVCDWTGKDVVVYFPNLNIGNFAFWGSKSENLYVYDGKSRTSAFAPLSGFTTNHQLSYLGKVSNTANYTLVSVTSLREARVNLAYAESIIELLGGDGLGTTTTYTVVMLDLTAPKVKRVSLLHPYGGLSNGFRAFILRGGLPQATDISRMLATSSGGGTLSKISEITFSGCEASFPACKKASNAFLKCGMFDQFIAFPSLHTGDDMFLNSGMSAANISAVLDSLPPDPVSKGGTGVITFTGCPGASELTQDSASVAAATARGWTVEL